ncbi:MAG TPA: hypothetical protein DDY77_05820, partial [Clostridiales bacterium]|nr:hypothetical protein [Clostridiales bacterium]
MPRKGKALESKEIKLSVTTLRKRLTAIVLAAIFLFLIIAVRFFLVTAVDGDKLKAKAIDQWTRELPIKARRGEIFDSAGRVLATSATVYGVYVRPRSVADI